MRNGILPGSLTSFNLSGIPFFFVSCDSMGKYTQTSTRGGKRRGWWVGGGHKSGLHKEGINDITGCGELSYIREV